MSHMCSAEEMSELFGPSVKFHPALAKDVSVFSPCNRRFLVFGDFVFPLGQRLNFVLGSDPDTCDLVLLSTRVNARHARLFFDNGCYFLEDLGTEHGTYINGRRIMGTAELRVGDEIMIKPYRITYTAAHG